MSEYRETLERELGRLTPPRIPLDQLTRRRERKRRDQRIRAGVLGLAIAVAVGWLGINAIRSTEPVPADDTKPTLPELRRDGEVIVFEPRGAGQGWDLAAQDPQTGAVRTIVETAEIVDCPDPERCRNFVEAAEWSPDGRWVAFEVSHIDLDGAPLGPCDPTTGVWVKSAVGVPRQLTTPCQEPPAATSGVDEVWTWSPDGTRIAYARVDGPTDELLIIDPSDGRRTSLGTVGGGLSELEWSPDGTRIAYADGGSLYSVDVDSGNRSLLTDSFSEFIAPILWSPDGTRILVYDGDANRLVVMNADGSDLRVVHEGADAGGPTAWSPDGDRILYQLSTAMENPPFEVSEVSGLPEDLTEEEQLLAIGLFDSEVWTIAPDGSNAIKVFDSDGCDMSATDKGFNTGDSLPVWVPNGTQVAYNDCGVWVVANADGTGDAQPIGGAPGRPGAPPPMHRSWSGGGLSQWDLARIGQVDH
jgi:Tol biopolymer transport system component